MPEGNPLTSAVEAEANLEKLATSLAQLGADENTVKAVSQMADVVRKIVAALGKGQEETGDDEPPAEEAPAEGPKTVGQATDELHQETQQARR